MGNLAKLDDAAALLEERRGALVADLDALAASVDRMIRIFTDDTRDLAEELRPLADRVLERAQLARAHVNHELVLMREPRPISQTVWWRERGVAVLTIGQEVAGLSEDMIGLLENGFLPSEQRARTEFVTVIGLGTIFGIVGYGIWNHFEKKAEEEQTRMIESGEIEDCGCDVG